MSTKKRPFIKFGRFLARVRRAAGLTQMEAVEILRSLDKRKSKGVCLATWSRWENGHRLPPRTKIDGVSAVIQIDPKRLRQRVGYHVPIRAIRRKRHDIVASIIREVSSSSSAETRLLHIYALAIGYYDEPDANVFLGPLADICRIVDAVYELDPLVRTEVIERIKTICLEAKRSGVT